MRCSVSVPDRGAGILWRVPPCRGRPALPWAPRRWSMIRWRCSAVRCAVPRRTPCVTMLRCSQRVSGCRSPAHLSPRLLRGNGRLRVRRSRLLQPLSRPRQEGPALSSPGQTGRPLVRLRRRSVLRPPFRRPKSTRDARMSRPSTPGCRAQVGRPRPTMWSSLHRLPWHPPHQNLPLLRLQSLRRRRLRLRRRRLRLRRPPVPPRHLLHPRRRLRRSWQLSSVAWECLSMPTEV